MPYRYNQGADPTEMQQLSGNPFYNPTSPNPDFVRGLQYLYANLSGAKEKKKKDQQEAEDREWQKLARALQKAEAEQGLARGEREAKDYRPKLDPLVELLEGRNIEEKKHKREIELIKERGKVTKEVNLAKPTRTATELNDDYLADVAEVEKQYAGIEVSARGELQKAMTALVNNRVFSPETFDADSKAAKEQYKEYLDTISKKKEIALRSIDERYSDLPRARLSAKRRGTPAPAPPDQPPAPPEIKTAGTKKRSEIKGMRVKEVNGKRYVRIPDTEGSPIYEVVEDGIKK